MCPKIPRDESHVFDDLASGDSPVDLKLKAHRAGLPSPKSPQIYAREERRSATSIRDWLTIHPRGTWNVVRPLRGHVPYGDAPGIDVALVPNRQCVSDDLKSSNLRVLGN